MTAVMITGTFSMTAFANAEETVDETETTVKEEQSEDAEESAETGDALTPDGNMTLVDDVGSETEAGKQRGKCPLPSLSGKTGKGLAMAVPAAWLPRKCDGGR